MVYPIRRTLENLCQKANADNHASWPAAEEGGCIGGVGGQERTLCHSTLRRMDRSGVRSHCQRRDESVSLSRGGIRPFCGPSCQRCKKRGPQRRKCGRAAPQRCGAASFPEAERHLGQHGVRVWAASVVNLRLYARVMSVLKNISMISCAPAAGSWRKGTASGPSLGGEKENLHAPPPPSTNGWCMMSWYAMHGASSESHLRVAPLLPPLRWPLAAAGVRFFRRLS